MATPAASGNSQTVSATTGVIRNNPMGEQVVSMAHQSLRFSSRHRARFLKVVSQARAPFPKYAKRPQLTCDATSAVAEQRNAGGLVEVMRPIGCPLGVFCVALTSGGASLTDRES